MSSGSVRDPASKPKVRAVEGGAQHPALAHMGVESASGELWDSIACAVGYSVQRTRVPRQCWSRVGPRDTWWPQNCESTGASRSQSQNLVVDSSRGAGIQVGSSLWDPHTGFLGLGGAWGKLRLAQLFPAGGQAEGSGQQGAFEVSRPMETRWSACRAAACIPAGPADP